MADGAADPSDRSWLTDLALTESAADELLPRLLRAARRHLKMDVSFISEITGGRRVFRHVDPPDNGVVRPEAADPIGDSYCQRIIDGRLPELIVDAAELPAARELAATRELPVGAHLSVPLVFSDGHVYGTFCCFSHRPDPSLNERDLGVIRMFADVASHYLEKEIETARGHERMRRRIHAAATDEGQLTTLYQPIVRLEDGRTIGVEALSRFPDRTPDVWFAEASSVGLGPELEARAIRSALAALPRLPDGAYLAVNVSPDVASFGVLEEELAETDVHRLVLEMTEHAPVDDYEGLAGSLGPLRERGLQISVDDAGAGYASFRHILRLRPEWIKLDIDITRGIHADSARRALASSLIAFAEDSSSGIVAEGVETIDELRTLEALGATAVQGFYLRRPTGLDEVLTGWDLYANSLEQRPAERPRARSHRPR